VKWAQAPDFWVAIYHYAWFVSFGLSLFTYLALTFGLPSSTAIAEQKG